MNDVTEESYRKFAVYRKRFLKFDLVAGIVVALVAIPLCLGIALASNAPLFSGILAGIIGGIVVGILSGSQVSVSGPAAGMAAIVATAISQLGDFNTFLLAVAFAGFLQIIIGSLKAGFIAEYVPSNVVQGLLCAIGILLIIKQLPLAFTLSSNLPELETRLLETTESISWQPLAQLSHHLNPGAIIISLISFAVLIYFDKTKRPRLKEIPAPIIVVIIGILINEFFLWTASALTQAEPQLVNIPNTDGLTGLVEEFTMPNWQAWSNPLVYFYGFIIATVASLETLLNLKAAEKLDKKHRISCKDKELLAQGTGNLLAGLIGAIPITSVIVRTSVNVQAGSKTKMAAVFHGFLLLLAVWLLPDILNRIPLASLAAILIHTGYKLTKPAIFKNIYQQGLDRFIPFIITTVSIIWFNLLAGILIGLAVSLFYILKSNSQARFNLVKEHYPQGLSNRLILPQQTTFLNKASLIAELDAIPAKSQLIIDARHADYIDKEVLELLKDFKDERAPMKQIAINFIGFKDHYDIHNYVEFINVTTYDVQANLTPAKVLQILREGNQRFLHDTRIHRSTQLDVKYTAETQHPIAVVLGCIDSRVPVETIFDMTFGDLFIARIAGNVVNNDILASIEYACNVVGAKLIVVLGHTRCGAITSACDGVEKGHITDLLAKIKPAISAEKETTLDRNGKNAQFLRRVTELNIANTLIQIYTQSEILRSMLDKGEIGLVGALYDVQTGRVEFADYSACFEHLQGEKPLLLKAQILKLMQESQGDKEVLA